MGKCFGWVDAQNSDGKCLCVVTGCGTVQKSSWARYDCESPSSVQKRLEVFSSRPDGLLVKKLSSSRSACLELPSSNGDHFKIAQRWSHVRRATVSTVSSSHHNPEIRTTSTPGNHGYAASLTFLDLSELMLHW